MSAARRRPPDPPAPDLSHLTEEERNIIESVLRRHRDEEDKDQQVIRTLKNDVEQLEKTVKHKQQVNVQVPTTVGNTGDVCRICNRVKFTAGAGNVCHYCQEKSCTRCGGRITLKHKAIWACNLCRKKQELSLKTGEWYDNKRSGVRPVEGSIGSPNGDVRRHATIGLPKQSSLDRVRGQERSSGLHQKRSSSAHTLTETDRVTERISYTENRPGQRALAVDPQGKRWRSDRIVSSGENRSMPKSQSTHYDDSQHDLDSGQLLDSKDRDSSRETIGSIGYLASMPGSRQVVSSITVHQSSPESGFDTELGPGGSGRPTPASRLSPSEKAYHQHQFPSVNDNSTSLSRAGGSGTDTSGRGPVGCEGYSRGSVDPDHTSTQSSLHSLLTREESGGGRSVGEAESTSYPSSVVTVKDGGGGSVGSSPSPHMAGLGASGLSPGNEDHSRSFQQRNMPGSRSTEGSGHVYTHTSESLPRGGTDHRGRSMEGRARDDPTTEFSYKHEMEKKSFMDHRDKQLHIPYSPGGTSERRGAEGDRSNNSGHRRRQEQQQQFNDNNSSSHLGAFTGHTVEGGDDSIGISPAHRTRMGSSAQLHENSPPTSEASKQQSPAAGEGGKSARVRRKEMMLHADSLSSDPSDCVRPPPPKPKHRRARCHSGRSAAGAGTGGGNGGTQMGGAHSEPLTSSEEDLLSTSCDGDEQEGESESIVSEKDPDDSFSYTQHMRKEQIAAKIKNFLADPVSWNSSDDGSLVGHMILKKDGPDIPVVKDSGAILGLKVIGGKMKTNGQLGAFITKVKNGSLADTVGHLRPGDEVTEWNGRSLQGATFEEVYDVVQESKQEPQVELIVCRHQNPRLSPPPEDGSKNRNDVAPPQVTITSPAASPVLPRRLMSITHVTGKIQLKMWYSASNQELVLSILSASELPLVGVNQPPQPYCKIDLLPDRRLGDKRKTHPVGRTREPLWNVTFYFENMPKASLASKTLEVTVWSLAKSGDSEYLGEVFVELAAAKLNDEGLWYRLRNHEERPVAGQRSGPSSVCSGGLGQQPGRMSDSDISELDVSDDRLKSRGGGQSRQKPPGLNDDTHSLPERTSKYPTDSPRPAPRRRQQPSPLSHRPRQSRPVRGASGYMSGPNSPRTGRRGDYHEPSSQELLSQGISEQLNLGARAARGSGRTQWDKTGRGRVDHSPEDDNYISDTSEISNFSTYSMRSTQSERPRSARKLSEFANRMETRGSANRARHNMQQQQQQQQQQYQYQSSQQQQGRCEVDMRRGPAAGGIEEEEEEVSARCRGPMDGSISDSAVSSSLTDGRRQRPGAGGSRLNPAGMGRKVSSTSQINSGSGPYSSRGSHSANDSPQRTRGGGSGPFDNVPPYGMHKAGKGSTDSSLYSLSSDSSNTMQLAHAASETHGQLKLLRVGTPNLFGPQGPGREANMGGFIEGLGPGQVCGRQVLGASCMGEIQVGLNDKKGRLEVEIVRARGLFTKQGAKTLPAPYVKVYLMEGKNCIEKLKTTTARKTVDPFYNQTVMFMEPYMQKILQIMVWGDYGRMDRKAFMGVAQISLDDLDLSHIVFGWYRLFTTASIIGPANRRSSQSSLESGYGGSR